MAVKNKKSRQSKKSETHLCGNAFYKTPTEMQAKIDEYFLSCRPKQVIDNEGKPVFNLFGQPVLTQEYPTVSGLALFLGFSDRSSMYNYGKIKLFSHTIKKAITSIERGAEQSLFNRDKCTGAIFWLKNHGWLAEEKREIIITPPIKADISKLAKLRKGLK